MIADEMDTLARRGAFLREIGKWLLLGAALMWAGLFIVYDPFWDASLPSVLLPARGMIWMLMAHQHPYALQPIWGGPAHLLGVRVTAGLLGALGLSDLAGARIRRRPVARLGLALCGGAVVLAAVAGSADRLGAAATTISLADFDRLTVPIGQHASGLVARLEAGERPVLPEMGGEHLKLRGVAAEGGNTLSIADRPVLVDRADSEALRFALAQRAFLKKDKGMLRRLLPIALPFPPTDMPARNDIARRLTAMAKMASVPATPAGYPYPIADWSQQWKRVARIYWWGAKLMHAALALGALSLGLGHLIKRRHAAMARMRATLTHIEPQPTGNRRLKRFG